MANRVGKAWEKFNTMAPLLCNKSISGKVMGVEEEEAEDRDCWRVRLDCMKFLANL